MIRPLLAYLDPVQRERENHLVTLVVPQLVPGRWYHQILHNANGALVKYYLSQRPGVVVSNFRYFLSGGVEEGAEGCAPAKPAGKAL